MIQKTVYIIILIYIFYVLHVTPIVDFVQHFLLYWNICVYAITHIKDNQPAVYVSLPFILVALLVWNPEDAELSNT